MNRFAAILVLVFVASAPVMGGPISVTVTPSIAPNSYGSSYWTSYVSNAVNAVENHLLTGGNASLPSYYAAQTAPLTPLDLIATGFPSWHGVADPGTVFGAAYASELGNRVHFGLDIDGHGTQFSISQLSFTEISNDPANALGFSFAAGSYTYSFNYVGIIYGPGGPTYITSGPNTKMVDRVVGRGSGNTFAAYCAGCTIAEQQAAIDEVLPAFSGLTQLTGVYTLTGTTNQTSATGSASIAVTRVAPEPATTMLIGAGLLTLGLTRRNRG